VAGVSEEVLVLAEDLRAEAFELRAHSFGVFPEVDDNSIFKKVAPLRIDALQGYIVFESLAVTFEEGAKNLWKCEDRGSKIEAESFGSQLIEFAADLRILLKDGDLEAPAREHDGSRHAAKPSSDDDDTFVSFSSAHDACTKVIVMV